MDNEVQDKKPTSFRTGTYYAGSEPRIKRGGRGSIKGYIATAIIASIITSIIVGVSVYGSLSERIDSQQRFIENMRTTGTVGPSKEDVTVIAEKATPSVVGIRISSGGGNSGASLQSQSKAEGSGIIISEDGYIATNYHVVSYADPDSSGSQGIIMEVFLQDGRQASARFIGGDEQTDLAVIKVEMDDLSPIEFGDSSKLKAGELAVVIGSPLGISFAGSVTQGCISAASRKINSGETTLTLIQTDAAVNPGNSGGALLNSEGKAVGIVNAKISQTSVEGLGFAIPINDARPILEQLMENGYVKGRPFIGISGSDVTDTISKQFGIPAGVYVVDVMKGSAAEAAGIKQGDVITQLAGKGVASMSDMNEIKRSYKPGDEVDIKLVRNGQEMTAKLTFGEDVR